MMEHDMIRLHAAEENKTVLIKCSDVGTIEQTETGTSYVIFIDDRDSLEVKESANKIMTMLDDRFIALHEFSYGRPYLINTNVIACICTCNEGKKAYSRVAFLSDTNIEEIEVSENPEKIWNMLNKTDEGICAGES